MPATFLLTASCCYQMREQFSDLSISVNHKIYLFFDKFHLVKKRLASSKNARFQCNDRFGNALVLNGGKPVFLRTFGDWLDSWQHRKISNCERFTLSDQTNAAMFRTLRCHANMIKDLLHQQYQFVLTSGLHAM